MAPLGRQSKGGAVNADSGFVVVVRPLGRLPRSFRPYKRMPAPYVAAQKSALLRPAEPL